MGCYLKAQISEFSVRFVNLAHSRLSFLVWNEHREEQCGSGALEKGNSKYSCLEYVDIKYSLLALEAGFCIAACQMPSSQGCSVVKDHKQLCSVSV